MTDAALDFSIEAMTGPLREPRKLAGIGGSDIAYLSIAFGRRAPETAPRWMREKAHRMKRGAAMGLPRGLAQRLGLAAEEKGDQLTIGTTREPELLSAWIERLERDEWTHEAERDVDPASVVWAGSLPWEWVEHRDPYSPLLVHADAYARTWAGELVTIDTKVARYGYSSPAWWNGIQECPWYYATQLQAYHGVYRSKRGFLVVGCGWNRDADDPRSDGQIIALPCDRSEDAIEEARTVARMAWELVPKVSRS